MEVERLCLISKSEREVAQIKLETYTLSRARVLSFHGQEALQHCTLSDTHHTSSDLLLALRENQNLHLNLWESLTSASYLCGTSNTIPGKFGRTSPRGHLESYHILHRNEGKESQKQERTTIYKGTHKIHRLVVAVRVRARAGR